MNSNKGQDDQVVGLSSEIVTPLEDSMCRSEAMAVDERKAPLDKKSLDGDDDDDTSLSSPTQTTTERTPNPWKQASWFSRLFFAWPYPLLRLGMERPLEEPDLPEILHSDKSTVNRLYLEGVWNDEVQRHGKKASLHRAILRNFFTSIWYVQPLICAATVAKVLQAVALGLLIETFEDGSIAQRGYLWAGVLVLCAMVVLFEHHHVFYITWHKGMRLRIGFVASIYAKSLRLSSTNQVSAASSGKIMNLASNDVERFLMAALFINYVLWAPVQSLAILGVGVKLLGPAFAAGFGLLAVIFAPMQFYLSQRFAKYRSKIAEITDRRVTLVSQAVAGARVVKMSAWENEFLERIQNIRKEEIDQIRRANRLKAWNEALFYSSNVVISIVIFLVHVGTGGVLTPRNVFTVMSLVNVLQLEMTKHLSLGVMGTSEAYVSISRLQNFLQFPEIGDDSHVLKQQPEEATGNDDDDTYALSLSHVTCYWNSANYSSDDTTDDSCSSKDSSRMLFTALADITLEFRMNELTCVIGAVGSGKSALLQALVGELPLYIGKMTCCYKTLAYAAQDPWIMDGTVRENILMGNDWNKVWYDTVVNSCGLDVDFKQLRQGDKTLVGDRGVQLSGGQRARIGLARALYLDADVLICDDPLSAVDARVGRLIFYEAIQGLAIGRGKCVVLATHQHQYVSECRCVLMTSGKVECVGSYSECVQASGGKLAEHAPDTSVDNTNTTVIDDDLNPVAVAEKVIASAEENEEQIIIDEDEGKELNITGLVHWDTFLNYFKAMGGVWVGFSLLVFFSVTQASVLVTIAALGRWAERPPDDQRSRDILGLIAGLGCAVVILAVFRAMTCYHLTIKASRTLHDRMTKAVLRAKIAFFDQNPIGRILNRFSADVGSNDDLLPQTLFDFLVVLFIVLGAIITTISVLPFVLIVVPLLMWYFLRVRRIFVTTSRELKRLEGLARSPIFAMMSESLSGVATIRANNCIHYFKQKFEEAHDAHSRAFFSFIASSRWVGFRMDSLMFLFLSLASFLSVLFNVQGWFDVDPAILGLALSMLLQLAGIFQWCIRQSAEVVNLMVAVERVLAFGAVEPEAPLELEGDALLLEKGWPKEGSVSIKDLSVRYRPSLPLSLENVTFDIPSGSRVGVVGRTGSGKSTLVQSLFRLLEADSGSIRLAGVDVKTLGLHTLRKHMSVISQVPVLFSGCSVRENLDPFHAHSDQTLKEALDDVHMTAAINDLPQGWDSMVAEGGSNFSVGQRQLLCLARAILRKNKLLICDECSANVDRRTDQLLQEALHKSFDGSTILSVAHRLDTVIDNDLILVLGHGHVLEFGSPADLLEKENGHFASMVNDTGESMSRDLKRRATEAKTDR